MTDNNDLYLCIDPVLNYAIIQNHDDFIKDIRWFNSNPYVRDESRSSSYFATLWDGCEFEEICQFKETITILQMFAPEYNKPKIIICPDDFPKLTCSTTSKRNTFYWNNYSFVATITQVTDIENIAHNGYKITIMHNKTYPIERDH